MNNNQKLRYLIDIYWLKLWIENLYHEYKTKVLKIEKADELSEEKKEKIINNFSLWINWLQLWMITIKEAKNDILNQIK